MAKKKLTPEEIQAQQNLLRIEESVRTLNVIYDDLIEELAKLAATIPGGISKIKVFNFADYPAITERLNKVMKDTTLRAVNAIDAGIQDAVLRANLKNDALVDSVFKATKIPKNKLAKYYDRNLTAASTRATKSQLSHRVYKITKQFKRVAEMGIDIGIAAGKPARALASEIRKAVKDPEFAYRRVRNAKGNLEWSKAAKKYAKENPGAQGVGKYLNPQKNFERLTRTEINMGYRTADHNRTDTMDFVVGRRVNLSTNPNHCPFCELAAGLYPKSFIFRGWHPQCRCYVTTVLKTREELERDNIRIIQGKEPLSASVNTVKDIPPKFKKYLKENQARFNLAGERGTAPYWLQDNFKDGKRVPGKVVGGVPAN